VNVRPTTGIDNAHLMPLQIGGASGSGAVPEVDLAGTAVVLAASGSANLKPPGAVPLFVPEDDVVQVGAAVKARPRPALPTPDEVAVHEATHHPYRNWCRHCVAGAGRRDGHAAVSVASRDEGIVTISSDYCYFNDEQLVGAPAGKHTPILISKVRGGRCLATWCWKRVAMPIPSLGWLTMSCG
jgi:hypothetical protein